ncbi:unnamed protein product [Arctia plantaginis]|uniref:Uncharacterized protein n=1 Tax=Arctia plantaginis TaxID=874455 RepID=A0A8S0ZHZ8_ARCPL|nr:unnamed protein product [Arctia plantaginis]
MSTHLQFVRPPLDRDKFDIYNTTYAADVYEHCTTEDRKFIGDSYKERYNSEFSFYYQCYTGKSLPSDDDGEVFVLLKQDPPPEAKTYYWDLSYACPFDCDFDVMVGVVYINGDDDVEYGSVPKDDSDIYSMSVLYCH